LRSLTYVTLGVWSATLLTLLVVFGRSRPPPGPATVTSIGPTREKLEALQELVIQKVEIADILTYSEGSVSAAWLVRGDGLVSVSLRDAVIHTIDPEARTAWIELPPPKVLSARVDHDRTMFWDHKTGFLNHLNPWGVNLPDVEAQAMRAAQRLVRQAVDSPESRDQAKELTTSLITNLYSSLGWAVTITWLDGDGRRAAAFEAQTP
jgi:hypothetical protein